MNTIDLTPAFAIETPVVDKKAVTVIRTTTIDGKIVEVAHFQTVDRHEAKRLIRLHVCNASAEGYEVAFTSRLDAVAVLSIPDMSYDEVVSWVAEFDYKLAAGKESARWEPTMAQYKLQSAHNQELTAKGLLTGS